jgi:hypothetical protein
MPVGLVLEDVLLSSPSSTTTDLLSAHVERSPEVSQSDESISSAAEVSKYRIFGVALQQEQSGLLDDGEQHMSRLPLELSPPNSPSVLSTFNGFTLNSIASPPRSPSMIGAANSFVRHLAPSPIKSQNATINQQSEDNQDGQIKIQLRGNKDESKQLLSPKSKAETFASAFASEDDLILADLQNRLAEAREMLGTTQTEVAEPMLSGIDPPPRKPAKNKGSKNRTAVLAPSKLPERVALPLKKVPMQKEINGTGKKKLSKRQLQESILRLSCNTCSTLAKIRGRPTPAMTAPTLGRKKETVPSATGRLNAMRIGTPACPPGGGITSTDFQMPRSPPVPPVGVRIDIQPSWRKSMSR